MRIKQYCVTLFFLLCGIGIAHSQETRSEFRIDFRADSAVIEPEFSDNARQLSDMSAFFNRVNQRDVVEILNVKFGGATSLEGSKEYNDSLTVSRRQALESYFRERMKIPVHIISYNDVYVDWNKLRSDIEQSDFRYKDEVIKIIDEDSVIVDYYGNLTIDYRILKLRKLHRGAAWRLLNENYFPAMRYANAVFIFRNEESGTVVDAEVNDEDVVVELVENKDNMSDDNAPDDMAVIADDEDDTCIDQRLAIKTNLVYDAILMPSLEVEYKINGHWSVSLEGDVAWWKNAPKHKYYQIATISPEVRYKFNADRSWHGGYLGVFTGGSWYDLENGGRGYRGEAGMLGISYNYMWPVGRRLSLEAGIGAGIMYTRYKEYLPIDGHYVYQQTSDLFYVGPLKLKFALVWRLWDQKCKGGKR